MTSSVPALVRNPLISLASPVGSPVPRRFAGRLQHIDIVTSPVLVGPLSRNPHTPIALQGGFGRRSGTTGGEGVWPGQPLIFSSQASYGGSIILHLSNYSLGICLVPSDSVLRYVQIVCDMRSVA